MLDGEGDFYIEDALFQRIVQWQRDHPAAAGREHTRANSATVSVRKEEPMEVDFPMGAGGSGGVGGSVGGAGGMGSRQGAVTPIRRELEDPDSSPLSSLDGTDGYVLSSSYFIETDVWFDRSRTSPVGVRKTSAPALQFPPTARGPFAPASPSVARARSADGGGAGGGMMGSSVFQHPNGAFGVPHPPNAHGQPSAHPNAQGHAQPNAPGQGEGQYSSPALPHGLGTPQLANHALPGTLPGTPLTTASATPVLTAVGLPGVGVGGGESPFFSPPLPPSPIER